VSRQALIDTRFSSVIRAPVYSRHDGLSTQVAVGPDDGLKHVSSIHCDELSLPKVLLTNFIGSLGEPKTEELNPALMRSLDLHAALEPAGY
jgi:mRNA interferase MazF